MYDDAAEAEQGYKVRYCHQGVHTVGDVPHHLQSDDTARKDADDVEHTVGQHPALALEILHAALAIIAPT